MTEVMEQANRERLVMGFFSYADDFIVSADDDEADRIWDETTGALGEIGLEIDQSKSCSTSKVKTGWNHKNTSLQERDYCSKQATEWNSIAADEQDASLAQKRLNEASEFAGHVEAVTQLHFDSEEVRGPVAHDLEVDSESPGLRRKSGELQENETSGRDVGGQNERNLRKAGGGITRQRRQDENETADEPQGSDLATGNQSLTRKQKDYTSWES